MFQSLKSETSHYQESVTFWKQFSDAICYIAKYVNINY